MDGVVSSSTVSLQMGGVIVSCCISSPSGGLQRRQAEVSLNRRLVGAHHRAPHEQRAEEDVPEVVPDRKIQVTSLPINELSGRLLKKPVNRYIVGFSRSHCTVNSSA